VTARAHLIELDAGRETLLRSDPESMVEQGSVRATPDEAPPKGRGPQAPQPRQAVIAVDWPLALGVATVSDGKLTARDPRTFAVTGTYQASLQSTFHLLPDRRTLLLVSGTALSLIDTSTGKSLFEHGHAAPGRPERAADFVVQAIDLAHQRLALLYQWNEASYGVDILDLAGNKMLRQLSVKAWSNRLPLRFSPDGTTLSTPLKNNIIDWEITTGRRLGERPRPADADFLRSETTTPDGRTRAFLDASRIVVEEAATRQRLWSLSSGGAPARMLPPVTSPDGQQTALLSAGKTNEFVLLRPGEIRVSAPLRSSEIDLVGLAFGPLGSTFASFGHQSGRITFWSPETLEPWGNEGTGRGVQTARWSPDGKLLAVADLDGEVTLWTDHEPHTISLPGIAAIDLRFTDDSSTLIGIGRDGALLAWSTATGDHTSPWTFGLGARFDLTPGAPRSPGPAGAAVISHEAVVHAPTTSEIVFVDVATGAQRRQPDCLPGEHATSLALSPRGHALVLAAGAGPGALCELTTGRLVTRLLPGEAPTRSSAAVDLSGTRVATVGDEADGSVVRVRDTSSGQVLFALPFPDTKPAEVALLFTAQALVVQRDDDASFYPLTDCTAVDVQLIERFASLGWLATDRAGHFDGDAAGRAGLWVRDGKGQGVDRAERNRHRLPGLFLGARAAIRPGEDAD
jgi:WD40 repeat protein